MIPPPEMTAVRTRTHSTVFMGHFPMRFSIASMVSLLGRSVMVGIVSALRTTGLANVAERTTLKAWSHSGTFPALRPVFAPPILADSRQSAGRHRECPDPSEYRPEQASDQIALGQPEPGVPGVEWIGSTCGGCWGRSKDIPPAEVGSAVLSAGQGGPIQRIRPPKLPIRFKWPIDSD